VKPRRQSESHWRRPSLRRSEKKMRIRQAKWTIESAGWKLDDASDCTTLTPADSDAALQISAFTKSSGPIVKEEIIGQMEEYIGGRCGIQDCSFGDFQGFTGSYTEEDEEGTHFTRVFFLFAGDLHLFITYNTDPLMFDAHTDVVDWILDSLEKTEE
jgi:hypothetical protein